MMKKTLFACLGLIVLASVAAEAAEPTNSGGAEKQICEVCGTDVSGAGVCFEGESCAGLQSCTTNADCPSGRACIIDDCCNRGPLCALLCDEPDCGNPGVCGTYTECDPLLVDLASFEAEVVGGKVHLTWSTSAETDNAGFRLLRARGKQPGVGKTGPRSEVSISIVSAQMIPAAGNGLGGASYKHVDNARHQPGVVYYYLEDIDYYGKATLHGPISVVIPKPGAERPRKP